MVDWKSRMETIREVLGQNNKALETALGLSNGYIRDVENGRSEYPGKLIILLVEKLRINPNWLLLEAGPVIYDPASVENKFSEKNHSDAFRKTSFPDGACIDDPGEVADPLQKRELLPGAVYVNANGREIVSDDFVAVGLLAQKVSAGPGQELLDYGAPSTMIPVYRRMLMGRDPRGAFGAMVEGDSMTGEKIFEGDIVIFYRGLITENGLYVLYRDGRLFVKRLSFSFTSRRIKISSANERYPDIEEVEDSQAITIAGKVMGWVHVHPY